MSKKELLRLLKEHEEFAKQNSKEFYAAAARMTKIHEEIKQLL